MQFASVAWKIRHAIVYEIHLFGFRSMGSFYTRNRVELVTYWDIRKGRSQMRKTTKQETWKNCAGSVSERRHLGAAELIKWNHTRSQDKCMLLSFDYRFSHSGNLKGGRGGRKNSQLLFITNCKMILWYQVKQRPVRALWSKKDCNSPLKRKYEILGKVS